jgi:hypothetical protein
MCPNFGVLGCAFVKLKAYFRLFFHRLIKLFFNAIFLKHLVNFVMLKFVINTIHFRYYYWFFRLFINYFFLTKLAPFGTFHYIFIHFLFLFLIFSIFLTKFIYYSASLRLFFAKFHNFFLIFVLFVNCGSKFYIHFAFQQFARPFFLVLPSNFSIKFMIIIRFFRKNQHPSIM